MDTAMLCLSESCSLGDLSSPDRNCSSPWCYCHNVRAFWSVAEGPERTRIPLQHWHTHLTKIPGAKYLSVHYLHIILTHFVIRVQRKQILLSFFREHNRKLAGKRLQKAKKWIQDDEMLPHSLTAERKQEHPLRSRENSEPWSRQ